jgi:hypothetical protein
MPRPKKRDIVPLQSAATLEQLEEAERREQRRSDRPKHLRLADIHVAEEAFQWRGEDMARRDEHARELARALTDHEKPLPSLLVTPLGSKFYVIDGHHRLVAYHSVGWKRPVPVTYFEGDLKAARRRALQCNVRDKLPMLPQEKAEAAWRLVVEDLEGSEGTPYGAGTVWSKQDIADATTVAPSTISNMRRIAREYPDARHGTWKDARQRDWGDREKPDEDWKEAKARKMAEQMVKNVGPWFKDADITAMALQMVSPDLPQRLIEEWFPVAREVVLETYREEAEEINRPELGEALEDAMRAIRAALFKAL